MRIIDANELPEWSVLAHRILKGVPTVVPERNFESTCREYNVGTYGRLLEYYEQSDSHKSLDAVRAFHECMNRQFEQSACHQYGVAYHEHEQCISLGEALLVLPRKLAKALHRSWVVDQVTDAVGECRTVVDLAAGYGFFLNQVRCQRPDLNYIGADGSANAMKLGSTLARDHPNVSFTCFDFYDPKSYDFLAQAQAPILVMTVSAIEQLPTAEPLLAALDRHADRIGQVVHLEPCYRPENLSTLGMMRSRYIENQNYNRDLLPLVRQQSDKNLVTEQLDAIGLNPLLPSSAIRWTYCAAS